MRSGGHLQRLGNCMESAAQVGTVFPATVAYQEVEESIFMGPLMSTARLSRSGELLFDLRVPKHSEEPQGLPESRLDPYALIAEAFLKLCGPFCPPVETIQPADAHANTFSTSRLPQMTRLLLELRDLYNRVPDGYPTSSADVARIAKDPDPGQGGNNGQGGNAPQGGGHRGTPGPAPGPSKPSQPRTGDSSAQGSSSSRVRGRQTLCVVIFFITCSPTDDR